MGQYFKIVDFDLMQSLYGMGKLGENVTNDFEELIRMICEVEMPPSLVAVPKAPLRAVASPRGTTSYVVCHTCAVFIL